MLQNMSTTDDNDKDNEVIDICANCGKEGTNLNICNRCEQVKYCNAACKKKHRSKHKKKCDRRVAELHDEQLFKQPSPAEDCPICFIRMPSLSNGRRYYSCCGKTICNGCVCAPVYDNNGNIVTEKSCPFCRLTGSLSNEEAIKRINRRVMAGDANAISNLGFYYSNGYWFRTRCKYSVFVLLCYLVSTYVCMMTNNLISSFRDSWLVVYVFCGLKPQGAQCCY